MIISEIEEKLTKEEEEKRQHLIKVIKRTKKSVTYKDIEEALDMLKDRRFDFTDDALNYIQVLKDSGRTGTVKNYFKAVKFVSYLMMGYKVTEAYLLINPNVADSSDKVLEVMARRYNSSKMVSEIKKLAIVPMWLTHYHIVDDALKVQVDLMHNAKSEMVRQKASETVLNYLKKPEDNKLEIDVTVKQDEYTKSLEEAIYKLAKEQKKVLSGSVEPSRAEEIINVDILKIEDENDS